MNTMISFVQKKSIKERVWKTLSVIVGVSTILNVSLVGALIAPRVARAAATSLSTQILSWNILGVDSNNPVTDGPHNFLIQARVTNTGASAATAAHTTFAWGAGTSYLSLVSTAAFPLNTIAAGASKDVFYVVKVTPPASPNSPSNDVFGKTRPFTITASSPDAADASAGQTLTIENIISQSRNHILSSTVTPPNPLVGQPFTVHVEYETSSTYLDITPQMTYNPTAATLDSVTTNYVTDGSTETDIYAQNHGNSVTSDFHFRAQSAGSLNFFYTVLDHSGNSYHYNSDSSNAIVVPVQPQPALTKSVDKATANPGDAITYTLNYANTGNIDLQNVVISETYSSWFQYGSATPAPTGGNNTWSIGTLPVGATGSIAIHGTLKSIFPDGGTTVHNVAVMNSKILDFNGQLQTQPTITATANTQVNAACNLVVTKTVDQTNVAGGTVLTYHINYVNQGNAFCTGGGVLLYDSIGSGMTYVAGSAKVLSVTNDQDLNPGDPAPEVFPATFNGTSTTLLGNLHEIGPGESGVVELKTQTSTGTACSTWDVQNTGHTDGNEVGSDVTFSSPVTHVAAICKGSLQITKVVDSGNASASDFSFTIAPDPNGVGTVHTSAGSTGTYTFTNLAPGNYTVTEQALTDYHQVSSTCSNVSVTGGQQATCVVHNARNTGNISFLKVVDNEPNANLGQFTFHANGNAYHSGDNATFNTGSYAVTEDAVTGYTFISASGACSVNQAGGIVLNVTTNGGTCTITNHRDTGTLVIQKDVINPDGGAVSDAHQFTVSVSGQSNGTIAEGTDATYSNLPTGTYTVTELADGSYSFVSYSLDNNANANDGAQVTVSKNATTTLLVTNKQKKVKVIVHKNVVGIDGTTDISDSHSFTANVNAQSGTIAEGTDFTAWVNPGSVTVSENSDANYALVSITSANFNVASGDQPVDVYVVNKQLPAHITVYKDVRAWDGSDTSDGHTFMVTVDGVTKNFGENAPATFDVAPGTYSAAELPDANYTLQSITPSGVTVASNGSARIDVVNDQNKVFDWTVTKSGPTTVQAGGQMTYDISWQVSQASNSQLANITINDPLPGHTNFVSCTDGCINNSNTVSWNLAGPFIPGQTGMVHVTVNVDNHLDPLTLLNTATVCGTQQPYFPELSLAAFNVENINPNFVCKDGTTSTDVLSSYELGLTKTDGETSVPAGSTLTYTLHWSANGNAATTSDLIVTDPIPAHTTYVASSADNGGVYDSGTHSITWDLGAQNLDANGDLHFQVQVDDIIRNGTVVHNTAQVCDANEQCANADDTTTITSDYQLTTDKSADVDPAQAGVNFTYTITWSINGHTPVDNALISDPLPANLIFVSASNGGTYDSGTHTVSWNLGAQDAVSSGDVTVTVKSVTPIVDGTRVTNTAEVCTTTAGANEQFDLEHCSTPHTTTTISSDFSVAIVKTDTPDPVQADGNITYTLNWSVDGTSPVNQLVITDPLPAGTNFVSADHSGINTAGIVTWNLGAHNPGDSGQVQLVVSAPSPVINGTIIPNTATICGLADTLSDKEVIEHCGNGSTTTTVSSGFEVSITKTAATTVTAGGQLTYTLNWSVTGNTPISNVTVTDPLPANTTFASASNGGTNNAGTVTWNLGAHNPGDNGSVTVTVNVNSPLPNGTILTNTAQVCATANNQNETTTQHCGTGTTTTTVQSAPSLSITKMNDVVGFTNPGKTVTYTVTVTNAANATDTAHAVVLTDVLPTGFSYVLGGGTTKNFTLGELAPGQSVVTTYAAIISADQSAGTYTNTASAQGSNTTKVSATSNVDVRVPQVLGATTSPDISITKSAKPTSTNPGKIVTYTVTIINSGDADATNVVLTDTLPKGFTFVDTGKATRTWDLGTLAANHQRVINYLVKVGDSVKAGTYVNTAVVLASNLDPKQATAKVQVVIPKVLGLATTGVSLRDYITFAAGLALMSLGFYWFTRSNRRDEYERA